MAEIKVYFIRPGVRKSLWAGNPKGIVTQRLPHVRLLVKQPIVNAKLTNRLLPDLIQTVPAYVIPNYYDTLYNRIWVIPPVVNLGSISTDQTFTAKVWNAFKSAATLQSVTVVGGEGITLTGQNEGVFKPLALKSWTVNVSMQGTPTIDCLVTFRFANLKPVTLHIIGSRSTDWAWLPDWSESVTENLEWLTRVYQSVSAAEQRVARRLSPRRTFEFRVSLSERARQQFEAMLYAYGQRVWSMPVFTDAAYLQQSASQGARLLNIRTAGYDFADGERALLVSGQHKEMIDILAVEPNKLTLQRPIARDFDRTLTTVYPLRAAVLTDMPQVRHLSDSVATAQIRLQVHEHNGWSDDIRHLPTYRKHPVLEPTSEWSEDITAQYARLIKTLDNETGLPYYLDTAHKAMQILSHRFVVADREAQRKLRNLFYYLRGRQRAIWVATASTDLTPKSNVTGNYLEIEHINYSALKGQIGRQDVRIECAGGQIFYRRIKSVSVVDADTERLFLDGEPLDIRLPTILKISFLTLSRLESDTVSWVHHTDADGAATVTVSFRGVRDDLETPP